MTVAFGLEALALAGMSLANFGNLKRAHAAEKEVAELKKQLEQARTTHRP